MPVRRASALAACLAAGLSLGACVVTAPAKVAWNTGKLAGKTVVTTSKGVYQAGKLTIRVGDAVLDGTERMLRLTILTADATGAVARSSREISATALEMELAALARSESVLEVIVDRAEDAAAREASLALEREIEEAVDRAVEREVERRVEEEVARRLTAPYAR